MSFGDLFLLENYVSNSYLRALIVFAALIVLLRFGLVAFQRAILKMTSKTKTEIDDIIIKKSSFSLTVIAFLIGLRVALLELAISETFEGNLSKIIYSVIFLAVAYLIYVIVDTFLISGLKKISAKSRTKIDDTLTHLILGVLRFFLIILALLYILDLWGIKVLPILGALGVAGIAVALALQPVLSNVFSGISMILDKSVRVGDWVVLDGETKGIVEKIGIRSTKIKSFNNEMFIVPNNKLADSRIQNVSLPEPKARVVIQFSVAYGSKIDKVKKLILREIKKISNVVEEPEPIVRFTEMAESSLNFKTYFYVASFEDRFGAIDEANTRIYNALNKAGISIPFPQIDVHLKRK